MDNILHLSNLSPNKASAYRIHSLKYDVTCPIGYFWANQSKFDLSISIILD